MMDPPVEVFSQGLPAIWEYLQQARKTKETTIKVQAWWRGLMVRKGVGAYSEILKMIKKVKKEKKEKKGKEKEKPKDKKK
ncbi:leucine-rich repeat and IQ domain-containing protein 4 [Crotalus adamanteus]|uniref:Leucine-rich repeat and IQ domain-containing protein 4 n=2 Tax=Crotalus TaxID=8728 RepID=A0AAW1BGD1_CROAD